MLEKHICHSDPKLVELARAAATDEDKRREGEALAEVCPKCFAGYRQLRELGRLGREAAANPILSQHEIESGLNKLMKHIQASPDRKSTD